MLIVHGPDASKGSSTTPLFRRPSEVSMAPSDNWLFVQFLKDYALWYVQVMKIPPEGVGLIGYWWSTPFYIMFSYSTLGSL